MKKDLRGEGYLQRLLSRGAYSRKDLKDRLRFKGCPSREIEDLLTHYEELGLIDDDLYAVLFVGSHPDWSIRRMRDGLRERGIDGERADSAIENAGIDEVERASIMIGHWLSVPVAERFILARLERRGFSRSVIFEAMRRAREDADDV